MINSYINQAFSSLDDHGWGCTGATRSVIAFMLVYARKSVGCSSLLASSCMGMGEDLWKIPYLGARSRCPTNTKPIGGVRVWSKGRRRESDSHGTSTDIEGFDKGNTKCVFFIVSRTKWTFHLLNLTKHVWGTNELSIF